MNIPELPENGPEYHSGMLIFRVRTDAPMEAMRSGAMGAAEIAAASPGIAAISELERAGQVKNITPLSPPTNAEPAGPSPAMDAMAAAAARAPDMDADPLQGTTVIELEQEQDVRSLQSQLAADPNIEEVSRVPVRYMLALAVDDVALAVAPAAASLYNLRKIKWAEARDTPGFQEATEIRVGVLDSGVEPEHPDLAGRIADYVFDYPGLTNLSTRNDISGHGTHVAGTIAAIANNQIGINGVCDTRIFMWKIFDDEPDYIKNDNEFRYVVNPIMYRQALRECLRNRMDVVNMSFGGRGKPDFAERMMFRRLVAHGVKLVAAMGNERTRGNPIIYPGAIDGVIAVGATNIDDKIAWFSSHGNHIALSAPGMGIWSTVPTYPGNKGYSNIGTVVHPIRGIPFPREQNYAASNGTSMAAPHVTAAVALLLANRGDMSIAEVRTRLMETADRVPDMAPTGHDTDFGAGRLNLQRLLFE